MDDDSRSVPNRLAGLTLGVWSGLLLFFYFSGRINNFLAPPFRTYALCAGVVLGLMALVLCCVPGDLHACADAGCAHPSGFRVGKQMTCLLLFVPLLLAVLAGDGEFSASVVLNRGEVSDASELRGGGNRFQNASAYFEPPLPSKDGSSSAADPAPPSAPLDYLIRTADGTIVVEVLDMLYAAQEEMLRGDFEGKTVQIVGQFLPAQSKDAKTVRFKSLRMFMVCCAADARPVSTLIEASEMPRVPEMSWLKVTGTATFPVRNGKRTAVIRAMAVENVPPPDERMLF